MARVDRRRRDDPRGPRRPHRPRRARGSSWSRYADRPLKIGSFSAASNVTGIVTDTARDRRPAARARRAVVLGLRRRRALRRHRDEPRVRRAPAVPQGRGLPVARTSSSAARARRACSSSAASCSRNRVPDRARRRHRRLRQPARAPLPRRPGAPRGGRHARRSSSRSAPGWSSSSSRPSASRRSAPARSASCAARSRRWRDQPGASRSSATSTPSGCRSCRSSSAPRRRRPLPAPQLRRRAAQRPVRHPVPRRLLLRRALRPPAARHRPRALARVRARDRARLRGHQARLGAGQLQLLHLRGRSLDYVVEAVDARRRARLAAAAATTASTRRPGCGGTATGPVEPPLRLAQVALRRRTGAMTYPRHDEPVPESALRRLPRRGPRDLRWPGARRRRRRRRPARDPAVSDDFEHLRWFELPAVCLQP